MEPLGTGVDVHLAVADALASEDDEGGEVVHGAAEVGGAVEGAGVGVEGHGDELAGAAVVAEGGADGEALVAAVEVGGGLLALGLAAGEGFPEGGPLGAGGAKHVVNAVVVEDLDKDVAAVHDSLCHLGVFLSVEGSGGL